MTREVRITIDDDELFERMKTRKQALDLSWEEVLHRGLRSVEEPPDPRHELASAKDDIRRAAREVKEARRQVRDGPGGFDPFNPESIERFVADTVRNATSWAGESSWDEELERVSDAEDAVLVFPSLGEAADDPANQVPLRVRLGVDTDGLTVEVVTIRTGKGVADMNAVDRKVRQRLIRGLATGATATLRLEAGVEEYPVVPSLTWSRDADGRPTVDAVEIQEVRFDGD